MSTKAVAWVLDDLQALKPGPTLIMLALADFADERHSCFPSQETLAARARCSRRNVIRHLEFLKGLGLVQVEKRNYHLSDGTVRRTSNRYFLNVGVVLRTESDILAHSDECAGESECDNLSPSVTECDKNPSPNVTPVSHQDPPVLDPPVPPSPPSLHVHGVGLGMDAAAPLGHGSSDPLGMEILNSEETPDAPGLSAPESARDARPGPGAVARGVSGRSLERAMPSGDDWDLISGCLPAPMRGLPARYVPEIAAMLRERLAAGWSRQALRAALGARALPTEIKFLPGLVKSRLKADAPLDAVLPASLVEDAGASLEERARAAQARRALIDACPMCDEQGWANTGDGSVRRCDHPGVDAAHL